jgi:hypothetical protein
MSGKVHAVFQFDDGSLAPRTICGRPLNKKLLTPNGSRTLSDFAFAAGKCGSCVRIGPDVPGLFRAYGAASRGN